MALFTFVYQSHTVVGSAATYCQIDWPIFVEQEETPRFAEIAFYKKNLPNIVDGASYVIILAYLTGNPQMPVMSFSSYISASCNSWQTFDVSGMVSALRRGLSTQTFFTWLSRDMTPSAWQMMGCH